MKREDGGVSDREREREKNEDEEHIIDLLKLYHNRYITAFTLRNRNNAIVTVTIKLKGVTMAALLAKATALAFIKHPVVNSSCRYGKNFTYNGSINIAVTVAIDDGLSTPVLQDADKVDMYSLSRKWKELVDKARAKQLQPHEYSTGTFTLSNLGMFGVDRFDAICHQELLSAQI
ncbi:hypothetical protein HYC85_008043 [Camellia sinensis]|uniref:2-oxoacid dehydrogenase acyltransferase catalytic domain-containing protein n=1 Tax=Camellia sinensis TaxID=4442 RepID=A0A7J7HS54_CAMSI|nr:hypothetical protein HYC85_008043 [Camellia sinensis]